MTDSIETKKSARVIFWVVGIFALVWNVMLSMNLFEQMSPAGVAALPEDYQIFFANRPQWAFAGFAVSVVAGLLAAVALLLRRKQAIWAFIVSFIGGLVVAIPTISAGPITIATGTAMTVVLTAVFAFYTSRTLH